MAAISTRRLSPSSYNRRLILSLMRAMLAAIGTSRIAGRAVASLPPLAPDEVRAPTLDIAKKARVAPH